MDMLHITLTHYLVLGAILLVLGIVGVLSRRTYTTGMAALGPNFAAAALIHGLAIAGVAFSCLLSLTLVGSLMFKYHARAQLEELKKSLPANSRLHVYPEQSRVVYAPFNWITGGFNTATPARGITTLEDK